MPSAQAGRIPAPRAAIPRPRPGRSPTARAAALSVRAAARWWMPWWRGRSRRY